MTSHRLAAVAGALAVAALGTAAIAQQPAPTAPPVRTARQSAQADLTGYWVAQVTEDWRWRMMTPPKGDYMGLPLNAAARTVGDAWDPARDAASGALCKAFGAGGLMRHPLRVHITWADDNTLKLETDLGAQTRMFHFDRTRPADAAPSLQGHSVAQWTRPVPPARGGPAPGAGAVPEGRAFGPGAAPAGRAAGAGRASGPPPPPPGGLKVVTTNLAPGYLRKNGVPYSGNASVTEYYDRVSLFGSDYLQLVTIVEDPTYLTASFIVSNHFKREADGAKWTAAPCTIDPPAGTLRNEPFVAQ
jgi:hypothetical protein